MSTRWTATSILQIAAFLSLLLGPLAAHADDGGGFEPKVKPEMQVRSAAGAITVDGELDEAAWQQAATATGFTEVMPEYETEPRVRTEALVTFDETHLYIAFRAYDDPSSIRASLRNRDDIFTDDFVAIILDTYGDASQAYELFVNPLGVQADALNAGGSEDTGFDLVFASAGRITDEGYVVEMAVPFSSLRFPERERQRWNMTFLRNHPRESRRLYSWASVDMNSPCLLCQMGVVEGIEGVKAGTKLEILPALVGSQTAALAEAGAPGAGLDNGRLYPQASLNVRYNLTSSLSAEATVNPDFSQVESDAGQIDANSTFALSLPERRPFFQEGADLFDTWIDVVYTRSINDPISAAKVTGRSGRTSVAFLSALDEHTPLLLPFEEQSATVQAGRSVSNIVRVRQGFGENSFAGATLTDRRLLDGGAGTLASVDARLQFLENYSVNAQLALSHTQEPSSAELSDGVDEATFAGGHHTASLDGERFQGHGAHLSVNRSARHWVFDATYEGYSPTFRAATGFVRRNAFHTVKTYQGYKFYPQWSFVDRIFPLIVFGRDFDYGGGVKRTVVQPQLAVQLTGQTSVGVAYAHWNERFRGVDFHGVGYGVLDVDSRFSEPLSGGFYVKGGTDIARALETPVVGRKLDAGANLTIKPTQRLSIRPSIDYASLRNPETDEMFFSGYIFRMQTSFQCTREFSVRIITEYDDFSERMSIDPLLSYRINPFSVFYLGSTHRYDQVDQYDAPYNLAQTERQLFFKFQYLFRR